MRVDRHILALADIPKEVPPDATIPTCSLRKLNGEQVGIFRFPSQSGRYVNLLAPGRTLL
jgi:hypothetical protein